MSTLKGKKGRPLTAPHEYVGDEFSQRQAMFEAMPGSAS